MVSIAIWWITRKYLLGRGLVTVYLEVCRLWNICSTISSPLQLTRCPTSCQSKCPFDPWRTHGPSTLWYSTMAIGNPHNSALCCDMLWYKMDKSWNGGFSIAMFDWLPGVIFKLMKHGRWDLFGRETWGQNGMGTNILQCKMLILQTCRGRERERERPERDPSVRADLHWPAANCEDFEDMLPECLQAQVEEKLNLSEDIEAPKVRKGIGSEENKGVYLANRVFFLSS